MSGANADGGDGRNLTAGILMFGVLLASYAMNAMDRQVFPLILPEVRKEYGFDLAAGGLLSTIFTFGMAVAGLPAGWVLARFTRRFVVSLGIFIFSVGTGITVIAHGFADMLFYRAATGVGEAMQITALIAIASNYFTSYRSSAVGALSFTYGIGDIAAPLMSCFGIGGLTSIGGGWLGDRFSAKALLSVAFFIASIIGYLLFHGITGFVALAAAQIVWGAVGGGTLFVNVATYFTKAVQLPLAGRAAGLFVTAFYGAGAVSGYILVLLVSNLGCQP